MHAKIKKCMPIQNLFLLLEFLKNKDLSLGAYYLSCTTFFKNFASAQLDSLIFWD